MSHSKSSRMKRRRCRPAPFFRFAPLLNWAMSQTSVSTARISLARSRTWVTVFHLVFTARTRTSLFNSAFCASLASSARIVGLCHTLFERRRICGDGTVTGLGKV